MTKELKITIVEPADLEVWSEVEQAFVRNIPATYYVTDALGRLNFIHTKSRAEAQDWSDQTFGKGKYIVKAAKDVKGVSKLESGGFSCRGTPSRKGHAAHLRKTV